MFSAFSLRKLYFIFLSYRMGYDHDDNFPFNFEPNGIPFGSISKGKLSPGSYPIQWERKIKYSFLRVPLTFRDYIQMKEIHFEINSTCNSYLSNIWYAIYFANKNCKLKLKLLKKLILYSELFPLTFRDYIQKRDIRFEINSTCNFYLSDVCYVIHFTNINCISILTWDRAKLFFFNNTCSCIKYMVQFWCLQEIKKKGFNLHMISSKCTLAISYSL